MEVKIMRSVISKGKNIMEAIELGLNVLGVEQNEVNIEVLHQEKKGFLKIGNKLATVKLSKIDTPNNTTASTDFMSLLNIIEDDEKAFEILPQFQESNQVIALSSPNKIIVNDEEKEEKKEAIAWVEEGKLFVQNTPTHYPVVSIDKGIEVKLNGVLTKELSLILSQNDTVEIYGVKEEKETKWSVSMDSNKLRVTLDVEPGYQLIRTIRDTKPSRQIRLVADKHKEPFNTLTYEQVIQAMGSLQVKYGFNHSEIMKAVETLKKGSFEIATGKESMNGQDGWFETMVKTHSEKTLIEDESGKINFREQRIINTVDAGSVIGVVHLPVAGRPGVTVTNEPLPAKQTNPVQLKLGTGVSLMGDKVVALESGRPTIEKRGRFVKVSLLQKLVIPGSVNLTSGNIRFNGDVTVMGSIEENMKVEAQGNIVVHQSITGAKVSAMNSIIAQQNVIGSELTAGQNNVFIAEMGFLLATMSEQIDKMIHVINQLMASSAFKSTDFPTIGLKPLIHILLERKFKNFIPITKNYLNNFKKGNHLILDEEWFEVSRTLERLFLTASKEITTLEEIIQLASNVRNLYESSQTPAESVSYINISSATNSQLYCSGNITILGKGCINTKIHSEGMLVIDKVLRGGEVYAKQGVQIQESGSENGTITIITVPRNQTIRINKAMEGTTLIIGNVRKVIDETTHFINARLNTTGEIVFDYL